MKFLVTLVCRFLTFWIIRFFLENPSKAGFWNQFWLWSNQTWLSEKCVSTLSIITSQIFNTLTSSKIDLVHISQTAPIHIQQCFILNMDMEQVHSGICETGLLDGILRRLFKWIRSNGTMVYWSFSLKFSHGLVPNSWFITATQGIWYLGASSELMVVMS